MVSSQDQAVDPQDIQLLNEPLRARVDAKFEEHQRAIEQAEETRKREMGQQKEMLEAKFEAADRRLDTETDRLREMLHTRIMAVQQLFEQHKHDQQTAMNKADSEREKAASALREALEQRITAGDHALDQKIAGDINSLMLHIENQKEQVRATFESSDKAIQKAEDANEKRLESIGDYMKSRVDKQGDFVLREVFDQAQVDNRRRQDAVIELLQGVRQDITEIQARGVGEKDYAAEAEAKSAKVMAAGGIAIAFLSVAVSVINLLL